MWRHARGAREKALPSQLVSWQSELFRGALATPNGHRFECVNKDRLSLGSTSGFGDKYGTSLDASIMMQRYAGTNRPGLGSVPGDVSEIIPASKPASPIQSGTLSRTFGGASAHAASVQAAAVCVSAGSRGRRFRASRKH